MFSFFADVPRYTLHDRVAGGLEFGSNALHLDTIDLSHGNVAE